MSSPRVPAQSTGSMIAWQSGVSGLWSTASDWSGGVVPGSSDQVEIAASGAYTVTINAAEAAQSLLIDASHAVVLDAGSLSLSDNLAIEAGEFILARRGSVDGGTLSTTGHGRLRAAGGTLTNVRYLGTLSLADNAAKLSLAGGDSFSGATGTGVGDIEVTGGRSTLYLRGGETLDNVTIHLGSADEDATIEAFAPGKTLTLGQSASITQVGTYAVISVDRGTTLVNEGVITASVSGADTYIFSSDTGTFDNQGTLVASNEGTIKITANLSVGSLNDFSTTDGGVVELDGTLSNAGNTLSLGAGRDLTLGGTIDGGLIDISGSSLNISGGSLDDTSFTGTLNVTSTSQSMYIAGGLNLSADLNGPSVLNVTGADADVLLSTEVLDHLTINLGSNQGGAFLNVGPNQTLTLGPDVQILSAGLGAFVGGIESNEETVINEGTITAQTVGGTMVIGAAGPTSSTFLNTGSLIATNGGTLIIDANVSANGLGAFSTGDGGVLYLGGTLANAGATLTLGVANQVAVGFGYGLGTIVGGVVDDTGNGLIAAGGLLDHVSYIGTLDLASSTSTLGVENGLNVSSGEINVGGAGAELAFDDSQALNNITINLGSNSGTATLFARSESTSTLTLGSQFAIDQSGLHAVINLDYSANGVLLNQGKISTWDHGGSLNFVTSPETNDTFDNAGDLIVTANATANIDVNTLNTGSMSNAGGALHFLADLTNNGLVNIVSGSAECNNVVSGSGTLRVGPAGVLTLHLGAVAGQTTSFAGSGGTLNLDNSNDFLGSIAGFGTADEIVLLKTGETDYSFSQGVLTVDNGEKTVASLHFNGSYGQSDFGLSQDGSGDTIITYK